MDLFLKGILQGSIPTVVIVGGTHHLVKKFRESKPVLYWGSLLAATGLTYAVVMNKVPAPFMDAENEIDRYYEHREEILEVKARLLEEEDYEDDQEAENDAIYEVFSKYYPEIYESEDIEIVDIDWETDGEDVDLPSSVKVPSDLEEDEIADYLSDNYGFLVNGFVMGAETFGSERQELCIWGCGSKVYKKGEPCYSCKYGAETFESEADKEGQFYDDLEEKIQAKRKEIEDLEEYMSKVAYGREELLELESLQWELVKLQEMEFMGAESDKPTITNYRIDGEQMEISVDYQGMPFSGIIDGGYWNAETFEARQNKDGTIVLTENEWDSCLHLPHKDHYLFRNKELKLIKHLKNGVKFEVVKIHSDDVVAIIREYEAFLKKTGRLKRAETMNAEGNSDYDKLQGHYDKLHNWATDLRISVKNLLEDLEEGLVYDLDDVRERLEKMDVR